MDCKGGGVRRPLVGGVTMKIAITSTGRTLESEIDQRFGRANFFLVIDTDTEDVQVIDNHQNLNVDHWTGIQAAETVVNKGVEVVITGHCGPNAFMVLKEAAVKVVVGIQGTVGQVVEKFKKEQLEFTQSPDVPDHWG